MVYYNGSFLLKPVRRVIPALSLSVSEPASKQTVFIDFFFFICLMNILPFISYENSEDHQHEL